MYGTKAPGFHALLVTLTAACRQADKKILFSSCGRVFDGSSLNGIFVMVAGIDGSIEEAIWYDMKMRRENAFIHELS